MATEPRNSKTRISAQKRQKPSDAGERYEDTMKSAVLTASLPWPSCSRLRLSPQNDDPTKSVYDHKGNQVQNVAAATATTPTPPSTPPS